MKLSWRWLSRHVDLAGLAPDEVALDLTTRTAEVEGIGRFAPALSSVKVGRVLERERHPDADKLSVCRVDVGEGEPLSIVCGAPNVRAGLSVAVATIGTVLPGDFKIKKAVIRGVESRGMICSERELGLGDEHDGIWELAGEPQIGVPVDLALDLADWVIEIDNKSLTHRPDLWGHRGIAGEIAAIRGLELAPLDLTLPATGAGTPCPVRVESAGCSRYLALPIDGVRAVRSPEWLRLLLLAVGQRPIDLLVDASNFVMLDLGQPNHLFDRKRIGARGIVVRDAQKGETLVTLDGVERELDPADMLICAGDEPIALAGVMGGQASRVEGDTDSLLLEVAAFEPATVRRTSARLGLRTDASARFEKHLDPTLPLSAAAHLVRTLRAVQPDLTLPAPLTDAGTWTDPAREVELRPQRVRDVLGADVPDDEVADVLTRLGFGVERTKSGPWKVSVPSARATKDVGIEEDLIEEVGRIHRYDRIPERALEGALSPPEQDPRRAFARRVQDRLAGAAGFREALTHTFQHDRLLDALKLLQEPHVEVRNPVAEGLVRIRRSVAPSLLGTLETNLRNAADKGGEVRLFEVGRGYRPERLDPTRVPEEVHEVALVLGVANPATGRFDAGPLPTLRGVVDDLVRHVERPALPWRAPRAGELPPWADPRRAAVAGGAPLAACLCALDRRVARALGVEAEVAVATVDLGLLLAAARAPRAYVPLPRFPDAKLDVALAVDVALPAADVRAAIERAGKGLVRETELFDLYTGDQVGEGKKSLAWHVRLQAADRTLSEADGERFLDRLEREIGRLGGVLRRE